MRILDGMARHVSEIMNAELFFIRAGDPVDMALLGILSLGITAAPVVDSDKRPLGVVSLRDLVGASGGSVGERMTSPADTVRDDTPIDEAARALAERDRHRFVVVDADGRAVGVVSSLDLLRAVLALPPRHPAAFPHQDAAGVSWTDPFELDLEQTDEAPAGPGLLVLLYDAPGRRTQPVWAEASRDVRLRLHELLAEPHAQDAWLRNVLEHDTAHLRVKTAAILDPVSRGTALDRALAEIAATREPSR